MIAIYQSNGTHLPVDKNPSIDNDYTMSSSCTECSQQLHTDLGVKLHRESHYKYTAFIGKYEKVWVI